MNKAYIDFLKEISKDELYDKLIEYGMFSEKLPPIFDNSSFLNYVKNVKKNNFEDRWYSYIKYNNMRNVNIPRPIGIPTPMAHERLVKCLSENWNSLIIFFDQNTSNQGVRKVSRIHIRKMKGTDALFIMNYKNWQSDWDPDPEILMNKKYVVHADISKCYDSIYTHALCWALVGKEYAKTHIDDTEWFNTIDKNTRNAKCGETHGILIGPHTSNILSEIILCRIDNELVKKYTYIRNIDDYTCYCRSMEECEDFLVDLNKFLSDYDLSLNHKKTFIEALPLATVEQWVNQLASKIIVVTKNQKNLNFKDIRCLLDYCVELMNENSDNASILYYLIKTLAGKNPDGSRKFILTYNARKYLVERMISNALLFPYVIPWLDEFVFSQYPGFNDIIEKYTPILYENNYKKRNYEGCSYALYFAIKYKFEIDSAWSIDHPRESNDCILSLLSLIYCRQYGWRTGEKTLRQYAKELLDNYMEEQWLFIYECLKGDLKDEWKVMKNNNVTFLKDEFNYKIP